MTKPTKDDTSPLDLKTAYHVGSLHVFLIADEPASFRLGINRIRKNRDADHPLWTALRELPASELDRFKDRLIELVDWIQSQSDDAFPLGEADENE